MRRFRLHIDPDPAQSHVEVDGQPVEGVSGVYISAEVGTPPTVTLTYGCYEILDITGHVVGIQHLCPLGERT